MPRRPSFANLKTATQRAAYERAGAVDTYLREASRGKVPVLSRSELARKFQTTTGTVEKYLGSAVRREGALWVPQEPGGFTKTMNIIADSGEIVRVPISNFGDRSLVARHHAAISALSEHGNPGPLRRLRRVTVRDASGTRWRLLTDEARLRQMIRRGDLQGVQPY
jgi:hypothetical protein